MESSSSRACGVGRARRAQGLGWQAPAIQSGVCGSRAAWEEARYGALAGQQALPGRGPSPDWKLHDCIGLIRFSHEVLTLEHAIAVVAGLQK